MKKFSDLAPGLRTMAFEWRVTIVCRALKPVEIVTIAYAGRDFESALRGGAAKKR
jgi:hypothetical protein